MTTEKDYPHSLTPAEKAKGGRASGRAKRRRKAFKDVFNTLLASDLPAETALAVKQKQGMAGRDTTGFTVADFIALSLVAKAVAGDIKAFEVIRDTLGEKPGEKPVADFTAIPKITVVRGENKAGHNITESENHEKHKN